VNQELLVLERETEALLERSLTGIDGGRTEQWVRRRFAAFANLFQSAFGVLQECLGVAAMYGVTRKAALDCDRNRAAADREWVTKYRGRRFMHVVLELTVLVEDRHECPAAEVSKVVAVAEAAFQTLGEAPEKMVANVAAMDVVDIAQALDVEDDDGRDSVLFDPVAQEIRETFTERLALWEASQ
jgi:hypothetical protein